VVFRDNIHENQKLVAQLFNALFYGFPTGINHCQAFSLNHFLIVPFYNLTAKLKGIAHEYA
jgi:hypothetical protein